MRSLAYLLCLLALLPAASGSAARPFATLSVGSFPQRRSDRYTARDGLPGKRVTHVWTVGSRVYARAAEGTSVFGGGKWRPTEEKETTEPGFPFVDPARLPAGARLLSAARAPDGRVWAVTDHGAFRSDGDRFVPVTFPKHYLAGQQPVNIDARLTCVLVDRNGLAWLGSDAGIFQTDGGEFWNVVDGKSGLPFEAVTCLAMGADGDLWVGTTEGVCRYTRGGWQYYWGPRWLPGNHVNALAVDDSGACWVGTDGGVARIYDAPVTLDRKAAHYEEITAARHNRRGFVTGSRLKTPGDPAAGAVYDASDNDGLWTAVYVAAESFRYAATREPEARALASRSMHAMLDLVKYTGVPGFPARALLRKGEEADGYNPDETVRIEGEADKIWFPSPVDPQVLCKGDTSSDELDGHYFAWGTFYDLAATEAEKREVRRTVEAVTDNLLNHDLTLVGPTGRKTRWGVFGPEFLNDDPEWWEERGLNSLSLLTYLRVAEHICGHARYREKYRELIEKQHYLLNAVDQKIAGPWWSVNHSDDEMAFMDYYNLLRLETDPAARAVLLQSLERSWKVEQPEASPFFNFVYGSLTGRACDVEASLSTLQEWPWELIDWEVRGSHRADVTLLTRGGRARSRSQLTAVLPASERPAMKWNGNPYEPDGGSREGRSEEDGGAWLLPYWMGRYCGFIAAGAPRYGSMEVRRYGSADRAEPPFHTPTLPPLHTGGVRSHARKMPKHRRAEEPFLTGEYIFPLGGKHTHASCVVQCPNGDLLATWYRGSGERSADDVEILGARLKRGAREWSAPFPMADTPGFPDCNPSLLIDPQRRLWLFWPVILANEWHTALLMSRRAEKYEGPGPPVWSRERPLLFKPGPEFAALVDESVKRDLARVETFPEALRERARAYLEARRTHAADKYFNRMGWMPRAHPVVLDGTRLLLPLYSDGFDFSLMAYTDDWGETWEASAPLIGDGPVQPSVVQRRDGTLVAFMRDNGGPPKRLLTSTSKDRGRTWSPVRDLELPNPGSGAEAIRLRSGRWALIYNDTERGRNSLAVSLSEDEGETWSRTRHLERDLSTPDPRTFAYPSIIQAADGSLHATYTYTLGTAEAAKGPKDAEGRPLRECIKHAHFNEAWVLEGDPR